jgi:hypothetical protein
MATVAGLLLVSGHAGTSPEQRTQLKPGWNLFSPAQDVEMGKQVAADAEKQLPMLNDRRIDGYLNRLGKRLAANAPGEKYPYQFKAVNDTSINAFALPGGFLYVNRGTIESADTEAQLAGVVGHEIAHAALRHGTNQASKAYLAKMPLAILGGVVGSQSVTGVLAQIGAGFATDSVLLKYSRDAERQADTLGTQILYDAGYDPRAMAQFFEKLQAQGKSRMPGWLSSHPNPGERIDVVTSEIGRLGGARKGMTADSAEFREIQKYLKSLPGPKGVSTAAKSGTTRSGPPQRPSGRTTGYSNDILQLRHPDNWNPTSSDSSLTIAPEWGVVATGQGNSLAYGIMAGVFPPKAGHSGRFDLQQATEQLIAELKRSNQNMRVARASAQMRVGGERALSTLLQNDAPGGGNETDWIVTVLRPEGLVYFVAVAPEAEYQNYRRAFEAVIDSVRFPSR